jgi:hypothetical protein
MSSYPSWAKNRVELMFFRIGRLLGLGMRLYSSMTYGFYGRD